MARNWIKIETVTPGKPEVCVMATHLKMDSDMVMGKLVRLWSWAEVNRIKSNDLGVTREFIDKLAGKKGFATAMERCGWLKEEAGRLSFPNFQRHNGPTGKGRALTAMRVAKHRQKKREGNEAESANEGFDRNQSVTTSSFSPGGIEAEVEVSEEILVASEALDRTIDARPASVPLTDLSREGEETDPIDQEVAPEASSATNDDGPETEDEEPRKRRAKATGTSARKVTVADSPDQPLLFGL